MLHGPGCHQCSYYCAPPIHATNLLLRRPLSEIPEGALVRELRGTVPHLVTVVRLIPVTEVVDVTAWIRQYYDGQDFVAKPGVTYYPVVLLAEYEPCTCEEVPDAVSVA